LKNIVVVEGLCVLCGALRSTLCIWPADFTLLDLHRNYSDAVLGVAVCTASILQAYLP